MNIVDQIMNEYRQRPNHGIQFSVESEAYKCRVGDRVSFGDNTTVLQCGSFYNYQDIILDGNVIGYLEEVQSGRLFDPMTISFVIPIADCSEKDVWEKMLVQFAGNPHLSDEGESLVLRFATLNQILDHLSIN